MKKPSTEDFVVPGTPEKHVCRDHVDDSSVHGGSEDEEDESQGYDIEDKAPSEQIVDAGFPVDLTKDQTPKDAVGSSAGTENYEEHMENVRFLVDVYLLADRLLDPTTANLVIDELIDFVGARNRTTNQAIISHVYASTAEGNPLRKLVIEWWLREVDQTWTGDHPKAEWGLPLEFLQDFIIRICALRVQRLSETGHDAFLVIHRDGLHSRQMRYRYHQDVE